MLPETGNQQYLSFCVNEQVLAVQIIKVKEIVECGQLTRVPMMQTSVRGVINLRGSVVPVVDLSARFDQGPIQLNRRTCVVIVEYIQDESTQLLGLMVNGVNAVLDISMDEVEPAPHFGAGIKSDFLNGVAKSEGDFVFLLNIDALLIFVHQQTEEMNLNVDEFNH